MNNMALSETTPVGSIVYRLEGFDPEGGNVTFGLIGSGNFEVNSVTGDVRLTKQLDREVRENVTFPAPPSVQPAGLIKRKHFDSQISLAFSLQTQDTLSFLVSIKDKVSESGDSENDNVVQVPISIIILDENDNPPEFQNVS
jgi:hypothetical protein